MFWRWCRSWQVKWNLNIACLILFPYKCCNLIKHVYVLFKQPAPMSTQQWRHVTGHSSHRVNDKSKVAVVGKTTELKSTLGLGYYILTNTRTCTYTRTHEHSHMRTHSWKHTSTQNNNRENVTIYQYVDIRRLCCEGDIWHTKLYVTICWPTLLQVVGELPGRRWGERRGTRGSRPAGTDTSQASDMLNCWLSHDKVNFDVQAIETDNDLQGGEGGIRCIASMSSLSIYLPDRQNMF